MGHTEAGPVHVNVRFGSAEFAAEVLPKEQGSALLQAATAIGRDNAISVLVQAAPEQLPGSACYGENALIHLFTFQVSSNQLDPTNYHDNGKPKGSLTLHTWLPHALKYGILHLLNTGPHIGIHVL